MSAAVLDAIATAAELQPADLVAAAAVGRPPRITGVLIADLLKLGEGAALVADLRNRVTAEPSPDLDDPDVLVLLTYAVAVATCRPENPETPRLRPPVLAQKLSDRYADEHAAGLLTLAVAA
jgi:hypothetical protein